MSKKEYEGIYFGQVIIIAVFCIFAGFVVGYIYAAAPSIEHDSDCLDKLANDICIEEGYESGVIDSFWKRTIKNDIACRPNKREKDLIILDWLEGEKELCIK